MLQVSSKRGLGILSARARFLELQATSIRTLQSAELVYVQLLPHHVTVPELVCYTTSQMTDEPYNMAIWVLYPPGSNADKAVGAVKKCRRSAGKRKDQEGRSACRRRN